MRDSERLTDTDTDTDRDIEDSWVLTSRETQRVISGQREGQKERGGTEGDGPAMNINLSSAFVISI